MLEGTCLMRDAAEHFREHQAIVSGERTLTYHEYREATWSAAAILRDRGVTANDHVAVIAGPSWRYPVLLQAIWFLGAVAVPIDHRFPSNMTETIVAQFACRHVVYDGLCQPPELSQALGPLDIGKVVRDHCHPIAAPPKKTSHVRQAPATILLTSGSSGSPKGVAHTLTHHVESAQASNLNIGLALGDRWMVTLPFHHVAGLSILFRTLLAGATVVIPGGRSPLSQAIDMLGITHLSLVAVQLARLLKSGLTIRAVEKLKAVLVGGGAIPDELIREAHQRGWPIFATYGSTEMASQITTTESDESLSGLLTSGRPLGHCEIKLDDSGEIMVQGRSLACGYFTGKRIVPITDKDGWFHTGDKGELDGDGRLIVHGRLDRMFVSGGENIHPEAIEQALCQLKGIRRACVFGVESSEYGMRPIGVVDFDPDEPIGEAELQAHLRSKTLPGYMVPDRFYCWPEIVETDCLKPDLTIIIDLWRRGELIRLK